MHPMAAVVSALALMSACLVIPVDAPGVEAFLAGPVVMAIAVFRPRARAFFRLLGLTLAVYAPMLVVLPHTVVERGAALAMTGVVSLGMMGYPALHDVVNHLPLPATLKLVLLQILHQASVLMRETTKVRRAMSVRGAALKGIHGWQFLHALPRVWIPRVIFKADRVAHALEVRGYAAPVPAPRAVPWQVSDRVRLLLCGSTLLVAVVLRWQS